MEVQGKINSDAAKAFAQLLRQAELELKKPATNLAEDKSISAASQGEGVEYFKSQLNKLGYLGKNPSEKDFDHAIHKFQQAHHILSDGLIGSEMARQMALTQAEFAQGKLTDRNVKQSMWSWLTGNHNAVPAYYGSEVKLDCNAISAYNLQCNTPAGSTQNQKRGYFR